MTFVICCRGTEEAMHAMRAMMERLKLTVNETKTRRCRLPEDPFDFLGYTIGRCWSPKTGRAYLGTRPSRKSIQRLCRENVSVAAAVPKKSRVRSEERAIMRTLRWRYRRPRRSRPHLH